MKKLAFTNDGRRLNVRFRHVGRRKKRPPMATICTIFDGETVVADAMAKPAGEIPVIFTGPDAKDRAKRELGRNVKKFMKDDLGNVVAILRGDNFSYDRGRKEAFAKAIGGMTRPNRKRAWKAYFEHFPNK